jgi:hypothetical protein
MHADGSAGGVTHGAVRFAIRPPSGTLLRRMPVLLTYAVRSRFVRSILQVRVERRNSEAVCGLRSTSDSHSRRIPD